MSFLGRMWARLRGKEGDPTFGTQIAVVGTAATVVDTQTDDKNSGEDATPDYGWSGDHLSGGSGYGGGGFDGGGGGGDGGGF